MWRAVKRRAHRYLLRDPAFRFLFDEPPADEAVAIDCETTGLDPRRDDIVTVAAVHIRGARILAASRFEAMVKPAAKMNVEAIKVHRLREGDVAGGRTMEEVLPELLRFIGSRPLVGYYLEFDLAMINKHARRAARNRAAQPPDRGLRALLRAQVRRRAARRARSISASPPSSQISACPCSTSTTPSPTP